MGLPTGVDVATAGTIDVEGTAGAVTMDDATLASTGADVRVVAGTDLTVGSVQTVTNVSPIAGGSIVDGGETNVDVIAAVCG